jgi:hypothetical protein
MTEVKRWRKSFSRLRPLATVPKSGPSRAVNTRDLRLTIRLVCDTTMGPHSPCTSCTVIVLISTLLGMCNLFFFDGSIINVYFGQSVEKLLSHRDITNREVHWTAPPDRKATCASLKICFGSASWRLSTNISYWIRNLSGFRPVD